jgi:L-rhamnose mutarotase
VQSSSRQEEEVVRHGQIIGIRPGKLAEYMRYHAHVWPEVLAKIAECNMRNYSIFHKDNLLFTYFEYTGGDFQADMAKMAADPITQEWWGITGPMQEPLDTRMDGEWWAEMAEVFHLD